MLEKACMAVEEAKRVRAYTQCCLRLLTSGSDFSGKQQVAHPQPVKGTKL